MRNISRAAFELVPGLLRALEPSVFTMRSNARMPLHVPDKTKQSIKNRHIWAPGYAERRGPFSDNFSSRHPTP